MLKKDEWLSVRPDLADGEWCVSRLEGGTEARSAGVRMPPRGRQLIQRYLGDQDITSLLDNRDLREQMTGLAALTPLPELRDAFTFTASLPGWASAMCASVEAEITSGSLGPTARQWAISSAGLTRLFLFLALQNAKPSTSDTAVTALGWASIRTMIGGLRTLLPAANSDVLDSPLGAPRSSPRYCAANVL